LIDLQLHRIIHLRTEKMKKLIVVLTLLLLFVTPLFAQNPNWSNQPSHAQTSDLLLDENIELIGSLYSFWDSPYDLVVSGNYAFVACRFAGLRVVDISNPSSPIEVGYCDSIEGARKIVISENHLYVTCHTGLYVVDISDPFDLEIVYFLQAEEYGLNVAVSDNYAFIAEYSSLVILDITNHTNPIEIYRNSNFLGWIQELAIQGNYLYAIHAIYLDVYDITDPTNPENISHLETNERMDHISVIGDYAYLLDTDEGLIIMDISNPHTPVQIGLYTGTEDLYKVIVVDEYAYVIGRNYFRVLDISDLTNPLLLGSYETLGSTLGIDVVGNFAFLSEISGGIKAIDISDPENLVLSGYLFNWGQITDVLLSDNYVILAGNRVRIVDISDLTSPNEISVIDPQDSLGIYFQYKIDIENDFLYIAHNDSGFQIVDISDPSNPVVTGFYNFSNRCKSITVSGDYAFIDNSDWVLGEGEMQIVDISNPFEPILFDQFQLDSGLKEIIFDENYAYLLFGWRVKVLDISDMSNIVEVCTIFDDRDYLGGFYKIVVRNNLLFTIGKYGFFESPRIVEIYDISIINTPILRSTIVIDSASDMEIEGNFLHIVSMNNGIKIFDISDPDNPVETGHFDGISNSIGVLADESYTYVVAFNKLLIFDSSSATDININDESDNIPSEFAIQSAYPNPFNPTLNVEIALPETADLKVKVFNVMGREVAELTNRQHQAGICNFTFDGSELSSGVYFVHASIPGQISQIQKVVLLK
jgi:hypothetical protein